VLGDSSKKEPDKKEMHLNRLEVLIIVTLGILICIISC